jgi:hypothetical protein
MQPWIQATKTNMWAAHAVPRTCAKIQLVSSTHMGDLEVASFWWEAGFAKAYAVLVADNQNRHASFI